MTHVSMVRRHFPCPTCGDMVDTVQVDGGDESEFGPYCSADCAEIDAEDPAIAWGDALYDEMKDEDLHA